MRQAVHDERLWFRINADLAERMRAKAAAEGASASEYLRNVVRREVLEDANG